MQNIKNKQQIQDNPTLVGYIGNLASNVAKALRRAVTLSEHHTIEKCLAVTSSCSDCPTHVQIC